MTLKEKAEAAVEALKKEYPKAECSLLAATPFRLLVAARLSAQCTDERVNQISPALFEKYPSSKELAKARPAELEKLIYSCGFYHSKAADLIELSKRIEEVFGGKVPDSEEGLLSLRGVGRKTANLILGDVYKKPAVVADTHLIRLSNRLGLVDTKNPEKVEYRLKELLPPEESNDFCHRAVMHGRAVCTARRAFCEKCCLAAFCSKRLGPKAQ